MRRATATSPETLVEWSGVWQQVPETQAGFSVAGAGAAQGPLAQSLLLPVRCAVSARMA